ncbi:MAG: ketoacyl-ACP synthase III, partial [Bacteroidota bacterium]
NIVSNRALNKNDAEASDRLIDAIGIEERRVANTNTCASDLCVAAAEKLMTALNWEKSSIDVVFFVTQTPDYILPGTSTNILSRLGLSKSCLAFDLNQGCAGYVYGLSLISALMCSSGLKKGLLLVGDTITQYVSPSDMRLLPIFSDAGTATAIEFDPSAEPMFFHTSSYGADYEAIIVKNGGARQIKENQAKQNETDQQILQSEMQLSMKGMEVFAFSIGQVAPHVHELIKLSGEDKAAIDYFVFHQANKIILQSITEKLQIDPLKVPSSLKYFGNTSGATIPLTLVTELKKQEMLPDAKMLLCGFGVGLSIASVICNFKGIVCPDLIELA